MVFCTGTPRNALTVLHTMDPSGAGNQRGPATPVGTSHVKASPHGAIQVHVSSRHEGTAHHVSNLSFCDVGREIWTGMRATEVRSDSALGPRARWDHHCSARWLTVREARPGGVWWNPRCGSTCPPCRPATPTNVV